MLAAFGTENDRLIEYPPGSDQATLAGAVWLDLVEPSADEEKSVEAALGIDIPTRGELYE